MLYTIYFKEDTGLSIKDTNGVIHLSDVNIKESIETAKGLVGCVEVINNYIDKCSIRSNYITKDVVSNMTCRDYYPRRWNFIKIVKTNLSRD